MDAEPLANRACGCPAHTLVQGEIGFGLLEYLGAPIYAELEMDESTIPPYELRLPTYDGCRWSLVGRWHEASLTH